jgi:hypothetical protein
MNDRERSKDSDIVRIVDSEYVPALRSPGMPCRLHETNTNLWSNISEQRGKRYVTGEAKSY